MNQTMLKLFLYPFLTLVFFCTLQKLDAQKVQKKTNTTSASPAKKVQSSKQEVSSKAVEKESIVVPDTKAYDTLKGKWYKVLYPKQKAPETSFNDSKGSRYEAYENKLYKIENGLYTELKTANGEGFKFGTIKTIFQTAAGEILVGGLRLYTDSKTQLWQIKDTILVPYTTKKFSSPEIWQVLESRKGIYIFGKFVSDEKKGDSHTVWLLQPDGTVEPAEHYNSSKKRTIGTIDADGILYTASSYDDRISYLEKWSGNEKQDLGFHKKYPHNEITELHNQGNNKIAIKMLDMRLSEQMIIWDNGVYTEIPSPLRNSVLYNISNGKIIAIDRPSFGSSEPPRYFVWENNDWIQFQAPKGTLETIAYDKVGSERKAGLMVELNNAVHLYDKNEITLIEKRKELTKEQIDVVIVKLINEVLPEANNLISRSNSIISQLNAVDYKTYNVTTFKRTIGTPAKDVINDWKKLTEPYTSVFEKLALDGHKSALYMVFNGYIIARNRYYNSIDELIALYQTNNTAALIETAYQKATDAHDKFEKQRMLLDNEMENYNKVHAGEKNIINEAILKMGLKKAG